MTTLLGDTMKIEEQYQAEAQTVLYHGDVLQFLETIPDETVKLIITSPPYNIGKAYETRVGIEEYLDQQKDVITELHRILHPEGSICWQVGNYVEKGEIFPLDMFYYPIFKSLGMKLRNRIVWHFGHGLHAKKTFFGTIRDTSLVYKRRSVYFSP